MSDCMHFPDTVEEFMEQYKMTDTKQVYSNGTEYVPIFRMEQWFEHEKAQLFSEDTTSDTISKTETVEHLRRMLEATVPNTDYDEGYIDGIEFGISTVSTMPTIQPQSTTGQLNDGARSTNLIDRQAAIDGKIIIQRTNGVEIYYDEAVPVGYLKRLPSAQMVATDTNVGDTISRQAAIDVLSLGKEMLSRVLDDIDVVGTVREKYSWGLGLIESYINDINELPPAQPEPHGGYWIRRDCGLDVECKCSKCGYRDFVEPRDEYWFKRNFCPNCGEKMKGERPK